MQLQQYVAQGHAVDVCHLRSIAYECKLPVLGQPRTLKVKHLLLLIDKTAHCVVFGIEIYVYLTFGDVLERHVFVAKADTTGLGARVSVAGVVLEFLKSLLEISPLEYFQNARWKTEATGSERTGPEKDASAQLEYDIVNTLNSLSEKLKDPAFYDNILFYSKSAHKVTGTEFPLAIPEQMHTRISLFTRSADAYLFPSSQKNPAKHVADGNQLFGWWINVLASALDGSWKCMADIPGADRTAVLRFLANVPNWEIGNIFVDLELDEKAVYCIPLFPDDPKGRFLEHLIVENRHKKMTTSQFWNELGYRQEFRLGNVVGIIGCSQKGNTPLKGGDKGRGLELPLKEYKKILEFIKGEDYSIKTDIQTFVKSALPGLFSSAGVTSITEITGTKAPKVVETSKPVNDMNGLVKRAKPVNNLTSIVKRKKTEPAVNNLNGLVRKKQAS